jgi:hypothetical protein
VFASSLVRSIGPSIASTIDALDLITINEAASDKELATPWYSDQVLPFDITIAGANEYGAGAACKIFGVEILNEGWGTSIDDAVSEMQATFVARAVEPMQAVITNAPSIIYTRSFSPDEHKTPSRARGSRRLGRVRGRHSARVDWSAGGWLSAGSGGLKDFCRRGDFSAGVSATKIGCATARYNDFHTEHCNL